MLHTSKAPTTYAERKNTAKQTVRYANAKLAGSCAANKTMRATKQTEKALAEAAIKVIVRVRRRLLRNQTT